MMLNRNLKILLVSSEVVPFAKTGGLADVAGSLPKALSAMGIDVRIVLPRYRTIHEVRTVTDFPVEVGGRRETCILRESHIEAQTDAGPKNIPVYFIDNYHYFDRDGMYMHRDEGERFGFFSKAVLEMLPRINFQPDVIHCNDWQSGPVPLLLKYFYRNNPFYSGMSTLFTVHNLLYQGNYPKAVLEFLGLGDEYFQPEGVEFYGQFGFMKTGLVYADIINTVSNSYAGEIQTPEYGEGLDGLLRGRAKDLYGIVNGISYEEFNPQTDPRIFRHYDANTISDKKENKYGLQKEMHLPAADVPVIGLVSRLVDQKGLDLIEEVIDELMAENIQFIVLGEGDKKYEKLFSDIRLKYPDKMGVHLGFDGALAQRIYAGSDMFLMPSRFEPCGLGQLIALRYGTIPIVRATGGLADTIVDFDLKTGAGNGFSFASYTAETMIEAIRRALQLYRQCPEQWQKLVRTALEQDFSWHRSAAKYLELYELAISRYIPVGKAN